MVKSSEKGGEWERESGKILSRWLTEGKEANHFVRSRGSGGWKTGGEGAEGWRHVGDLAPNGPAGETFRRVFVVECKNISGFDFFHIWTAPRADWLTWLPKLEDEAAPWGLCPWLMLKPTARGIYVLVPMPVIAKARVFVHLTVRPIGCGFQYGVIPWQVIQKMDPQEWIDSAVVSGFRLKSSEPTTLSSNNT